MAKFINGVIAISNIFQRTNSAGEGKDKTWDKRIEPRALNAVAKRKLKTAARRLKLRGFELNVKVLDCSVVVMFRCYEACLVSHLINLVRLRSLLLRCQAHASGPLAEGFLGQLIVVGLFYLSRVRSLLRAQLPN